MIQHLISHVLAAGLGGFTVWAFLRHVAGWFTKFETQLLAEFSHLKGQIKQPLPAAVTPIVHMPPPPPPSTTTVPAGGPA